MFDVTSERVTVEYVYRFEPIAEFDRAGNNLGQGLQSKILFVAVSQPLP